MYSLFACLSDGNMILLGVFVNKTVATNAALGVCPDRRVRVNGVWFGVVALEIR